MKIYFALFVFIFYFVLVFGERVTAVDIPATSHSKFSLSLQHLILSTYGVNSENFKKRALFATDSDKIWIFFASKIPNGTPPEYRQTALSEFERIYLTERARKRRAKTNTVILDDYDLPIFPSYLTVLSQIEGLHITSKSNWLNAVSINITKTEVLNQVAALPFVIFVDRVAQFKRNVEEIEEYDHLNRITGDKRASKSQKILIKRWR